MKIEHVAIWVDDLEVMKEFYCSHFGARAGDMYFNPTKQFSSYFLEFQSGSRLELMHSPVVLKSEGENVMRTGYAHLAISVGSVEKVDEMTRIFLSRNIRLVDGPRWTGDGYYESVIADPEGNRIEITV